MRLPERVPSPWSQRITPVWLAAAAALAIAVLAGWFLLRPRGPVATSSDLLARFDPATVGPQAAGVALETLGTIVRGPDLLLPEERAAYFKLGVRAFDLALATEIDKVDESIDQLEEIDRLLDDVAFSFAQEEAYQELFRRIASGEPPRSLRRDVAVAEADLERELDLPEQPYFAFGRWVEAVRVAAAMGDRRFLDSRQALRPLRRFQDIPPSPAIDRHLTAVSRELRRGAADADLPALQEALVAIITTCADGRACFATPEPG